jgi:predicted DNA-binding transcriptional regulator YafY
MISFFMRIVECRSPDPWIRQGRKIRNAFRDVRGEASAWVIWPVMVGYFEESRVLAAWYELRKDFRHFRTDRIGIAEFLEERHGCRPGELWLRWKRYLAEKQL